MKDLLICDLHVRCSFEFHSQGNSGLQSRECLLVNHSGGDENIDREKGQTCRSFQNVVSKEKMGRLAPAVFSVLG